jgi:hypothetical protein
MSPKGRLTYIRNAEIDSVDARRIVYDITLACGCRFPEEHARGEAPPEIGRPEFCFADHAPAEAFAATNSRHG